MLSHALAAGGSAGSGGHHLVLIIVVVVIVAILVTIRLVRRRSRPGDGSVPGAPRNGG